MDKPTAVIDKSLFHEICKEPREREREHYWSCICERYQPVVPFILIEEVLVNLVRPGQIEADVLRRMAKQLVAFKPCWVDDVSEIAFREIVGRQPLAKLPAPEGEVLQDLLSLEWDNPRLVKWVEGRKMGRKETAARWKAGQERLASPAGFATATSEEEFYQRTVQREFVRHLAEPAKKQEMLETILGGTFRKWHPGHVAEIDEAFLQYTKDTLPRFPFTYRCIAARLAYFFGPIVRIQAPGDPQPREILKPKKWKQENNLADEQYVITSFLCDRLLTRDGGMKNIAEVFRLNGLWKGQTIFINPNNHLDDQIPAILV